MASGMELELWLSCGVLVIRGFGTWTERIEGAL